MIVNKEYNLVQGHECLSACLGNYLNYLYPDLTGNEIIVAGGGFRVTYDSDQKVIGTPFYDANFKFMRKYGIQYKRSNCEKNQEEFIRKCIRTGQKIIIKVDVCQLTYNRVFKQVSSAPHLVNILGKKEDELYICDGYVPTREASVFEGWVSCQSVIKAWKKMNAEYIILDKQIKIDCPKIQLDMMEILHRNIQEYITGGIKNDVFYGYTAILQLFEDIKKQMEKQYIQKLILEYNYQIKIFGFLSMKIILREILIKMNMMELATSYNDVIKHWNIMCTILVKMAFSKSERILQELQNKIIDCIQKEERILLQIMSNI